MKKLLLLTIAICYLTAGCYSQTDWKSFMSRQDMTWTRLPQTWYEAPLHGKRQHGFLYLQRARKKTPYG